MGKEITSQQHTTWRCRNYWMSASEISKDGGIRANQNRYRANLEEAVRVGGMEIIEAEASLDAPTSR